MTTPELIGQKPKTEYKTALPDVTFRDIEPETLPELKRLVEENAEHISRGGIVPDYIYESTERELSGDNPHDHQRMGIWKDDVLVGYAAIVPAEYSKIKNAVEVSYIVDPKYGRQGIARAVVEAITDIENEKGHNVIAEVERYNVASIRLLGKLGFELSGRSDGRDVYARSTLTESEIYRRLGL